MQATISGAGICVLPGFIADNDPKLIAVLPAEISIKRSLYLVVHADLRDLARVKATSDFIVKQVRKAQSLFIGKHDAAAPCAV